MLELVKQNESVISSLKEGRDMYGKKLSKKIIQKSLELESLFKGIDQVKLYDGFSDWGTSYSLCVKINNPHHNKSEGNLYLSNQKEWDMLMNIFPQKKGKGYNIRDYRLMNSVKDSSMELVGFNNVLNLSLEDLVERLFNNELSLSMLGMMNVENQTSSENVDYSVQNILMKSKESFDFGREELKEQLLNKLKN